MYTPLWCKSNFSFREGASHPEELVTQAAAFGLPALALTDRDGVYGIVRAHGKAKEVGVHLIIGSEVTVDDGSTIVLLAEDRSGYGRLCRLISGGRLRCAKGESRVTWEEVAASAQGLVALWGGERSLIAQEGESWEAFGTMLQDAFADRLFALLPRHRTAEERESERRLRKRASALDLPLVAAPEVLYHHRRRRALQDVLTCIRHGVPLASARRRLKANDEYALLDAPAMAALYADVPEALMRTLDVAARCTFSLDDIRYRYPSESLPDGTTTSAWLRHLTFEGANNRYGAEIPDDVVLQLDKELAVIEELDYGGYFLTMWEIVQFCRQEEILCQGRGSAANSAVCFCLGITAIDPVRMGLLFERFLSRERAEPPDVDLDIQHGRREEVLQHVYGKYGRDRAAMVANLVRYRPRSAVRDVGKTLGIPETALDRLAKLLPWYGEITDDILLQGGLDPTQPGPTHLLRLANEIQDFPRHLSIHPGGFLLGQEPVCELVPIENATMDARTVIQWDKEDIEAMGLFKVDLLGLGALTHLDLCFRLLKEHRGRDLSMATIPPDDAATFAMASRADTVGVFQIESRAQMAMLPRLRPRTFYDLVIEVSLVRPGPISGGMVHPYLRRRNGEEPVTYPHPSLEPVLSKTLGVPLFQEQVMRLAVVAADYSPGEADQLRRDMAAWRKTGSIDKHRDLLITRMEKKGIAREFAERVFQQIQGFGEYGFPESHAASFALISYATAYLRCHEPDIFTCAILNAQPMGFYSPATLIEDARRCGVVVRPVDVTVSAWDCALEPDADDRFAVRVGLRFVSGIRRQTASVLLDARDHAPFASLEDCVRRVPVGLPEFLKLSEAGAFQTLEPDRRQALWAVRRLAHTRSIPLASDLPETPIALEPLTSFEEIGWDYERLSLSTRGHPLQIVRDQLTTEGFPDAATVTTLPHGTRVRYTGAVICRQRPSTAKGVTFITLEDETGFVNLVIWTSTFERHQTILKTASLLAVEGLLENQQGTTHLIVDRAWQPRLDWAGATKSRDFR